MTKTIRFCIFFLAVTLLSIAAQRHNRPVFDQKPSIAAANAFLQSLLPAQKASAQLRFDDTTRTRWSNLPMEQCSRRGIWLNDLTDAQKIQLHALLRSVLSVQGYQKILFIIQYDEDTKQRLSVAQNPIASRYGQEKYWITIFGDPDAHKTWGWKFEGHHISLNFTHAPSGVTGTPMFIGINPAMTTTGAFAGRYLLQDENELGKQLFAALSPALQQQATLGPISATADPMEVWNTAVALRDALSWLDTQAEFEPDFETMEALHTLARVSGAWCLANQDVVLTIERRLVEGG